MSNETIKNGLPTYTPYFGGCPICWKQDGHLNYGRDHWCVCHDHKKKWYVGSNLFSGWREENEAIWEDNAKLLAGFEKCEPAMCLEPEIGGYCNDVAMQVPGVAARQLRAIQDYAREQIKPRPYNDNIPF